MKLKIATWNIGEDESNEKCLVNNESYTFIKETIDKYQIDILCMQEAITSSDLMLPIKDYLKDNTPLTYSVDLEYAESHINIGSMMGVVICSKYPLSNKQTVMFNNPGLVYKKSETQTYYMHDKGFVMADLEAFNLSVVTGHGIPFHAFKRDVLEFMDVFTQAETDLISKLNLNQHFIITGDMNHTSFANLFPKLNNLTNSNINEPTRTSSTGEESQLDYIMTSKSLMNLDSLVLKNRFDHKLCITEIEIGEH